MYEKVTSPRRYSGTYRRKRRQKAEIDKAQRERNSGKVVESPEKPMDRPSLYRHPGGVRSPGTTQYDDAAKQKPAPGSVYKPGDIDQKNTMWVRARKDPKTGKVIEGGYLAYRNDWTRNRVKDPLTKKPRYAKRGDRFSGLVRIPANMEGSTYAEQVRMAGRGGAESGPSSKYLLARYVDGRNVNNPNRKSRSKASGRSEKTRMQAKPASRKQVVKQSVSGMKRATALQNERKAEKSRGAGLPNQLVLPWQRKK